MVEGETDAQRLAEQARTHRRATAEHLEAALEGQGGAHQRFLLAPQLRQGDHRTGAIACLAGEIEVRMRPFAAVIARLDTIPGSGVQRAQESIAAIGVAKGGGWTGPAACTSLIARASALVYSRFRSKSRCNTRS
jgi:transposase